MALPIEAATADCAAFFYPRWRAARNALVLALAALVLTFFSLKHDHGAVVAVLITVVVMPTIVICAWSALLSLSLMFGSRPVVVIDAEGVSLPLSLRTKILWSQVRSVRDIRIGLEIRCPADLRRQRTLFASLCGATYNPFVVVFAGLDAPAWHVRESFQRLMPLRMLDLTDKDPHREHWSM